MGWAMALFWLGQREQDGILVDSVIEVQGLWMDLVTFLPLLGSCVFCPNKIHMKWIAQNALGSYVSSCIFYGTTVWRTQGQYWNALDKAFNAGNVGATSQLFAMVFGTVVWCCVIGPITQCIILNAHNRFLSGARLL